MAVIFFMHFIPGFVIPGGVVLNAEIVGKVKSVSYTKNVSVGLKSFRKQQNDRKKDGGSFFSQAKLLEKVICDFHCAQDIESALERARPNHRTSS